METKTNLNEETISKMQRLIEANIDSYEGFQETAKDVDDASMSSLFERLSVQRAQNAKALQQFVQLNHEEAKESGTARGAVHRAWIQARAAINGGNPEVVLIEASRGEDHIKSLYEDVLKDIPANAMSDVLHKQYAKIKSDYELIRALRKAHD